MITDNLQIISIIFMGLSALMLLKFFREEKEDDACQKRIKELEEQVQALQEKKGEKR